VVIVGSLLWLKMRRRAASAAALGNG